MIYQPRASLLRKANLEKKSVLPKAMFVSIQHGTHLIHLKDFMACQLDPPASRAERVHTWAGRMTRLSSLQVCTHVAPSMFRTKYEGRHGNTRGAIVSTPVQLWAP
jgi:hypothetical protein